VLMWPLRAIVVGWEDVPGDKGTVSLKGKRMKATFDSNVLVRLVDRQEIWDCLLRYIRGVDRMDQDLVRSAFWEDAINTHGPVRGSVDDFIAAWLPVQAARDVSFHMVSNQSVEFADEAAHCEAYFMAGIKQTESDQIEVVGGRYIDHFEKRGSEWRIKTRLVLLDWQGLMDATQMKARLAKRHRGSRNSNDPSYERPVRPRDAIVTSW